MAARLPAARLQAASKDASCKAARLQAASTNIRTCAKHVLGRIYWIFGRGSPSGLSLQLYEGVGGRLPFLAQATSFRKLLFTHGSLLLGW